MRRNRVYSLPQIIPEYSAWSLSRKLTQINCTFFSHFTPRPKQKNNSDQAYSCPRCWHLSRHDRGPYWVPPGTPRTIKALSFWSVWGEPLTVVRIAILLVRTNRKIFSEPNFTCNLHFSIIDLCTKRNPIYCTKSFGKL